MSRAIELVDESLPEYPVLGSIAAGKPIEVMDHREVMALLPNAGDKEIFVLRG